MSLHQLLTSDESNSSSTESDQDSVFEVIEEPTLEMKDEENEWTIVNDGEDDRAGQLPEFLGVHGMNPGVQAPANEPLLFFNLFTKDIISHLKEFTNARAWEELRIFENEEDDQQLPPRLTDWRDCADDEIKKTIAIIFYMGIVRKPEIKNYWATGKFYDNQLFLSENCLSRNRFQQILSFLRFYDCRVGDNDDPLRKIRPFLNSVKEVCQQNFQPDRDIAVDEELVQHKGRLAFKQYIPSKRARYGIKAYCLCDSKTGYLWSVLVHSTAEENSKFGSEFVDYNLSISERIVVELRRTC
ncbi:hypothetical protein BOX15_Mlig029229g1 [Macrostomum lignano]|uniref:PiggyBac transposable element-derived protein domain-containing protein n=1 Tax=Macrostomum lignano TaxID=282301 RepID=A0A267EBE2_9PLAT|nr:hypothetical protein BOX15_Mlig029229g1 [Macrostomum lignano]